MFPFIYRTKNVVLLYLLLQCGLIHTEELKKPPKVSLKTNLELIVVITNINQYFSIACDATGYPQIMFSWYKNNIQVSDAPGSNIEVFKNGTLYIKEFRRENDGYYQCRATNDLGTSVSSKVFIVLQRPPQPITDVGSKDMVSVSVKEGESLHLPCSKTELSYPVYSRKWYYPKMDGIVTAAPEEVDESNRTGIDADGTLRFSYVKKVDEKVYACSYVLLNQPSVPANSFKLTVEQLSGLAQRQPKLEFKSENVVAILGKQAILECFFSGYPDVSITWRDRNNHPLIRPEHPRYSISSGYFNRKLVIDRVEEEDEIEQFKCVGNNGHGEDYGTISINVTSPPMKVPHKGLQNFIKPSGYDVTLMCHAKAAPGERLNLPVWYRNAEPFKLDLLVDPWRYSFNSHMTELSIRNVSKTADTANIQCNVSNSEGHVFYDAYLLVIDSIQIVRRPSSSVEVTTKDPVDISVAAKGDSCCIIIYNWFFDNTRLTDGELHSAPLFYNLEKKMMTFNPVNVTESVLKSRLGEYRVEILNGYQTVNVSFMVSLKAMPEPEAVAISSGFELWWIAIIVIIILLIISIIVIACCIRANHPRETYNLAKTEEKHNMNPEEELLNKSFPEFVPMESNEGETNKYGDPVDLPSSPSYSVRSEDRSQQASFLLTDP